MPTFKQSKEVNGLFNDASIANAVEDVLRHNLGLREASRKHGIHHTTIRRYVLKAKTTQQESGYNIKKLSMVTKQVRP